MTATATETVTTNDTWTTEIEQLRSRYKNVREPILAALNVLLHDANVSADDAKARAAMRGVRITAASVNAARTLLSRMDATPAPAAAPKDDAPVRRAVRRVRGAETAVDAEQLIRQVVDKLQNQGNAEAERLREAIRKAVQLLQSALR
ncbi:MAG: hypothetical protein ABIP94_07540 [Planctomycetota bacterium]